MRRRTRRLRGRLRPVADAARGVRPRDRRAGRRARPARAPGGAAVRARSPARRPRSPRCGRPARPRSRRAGAGRHGRRRGARRRWSPRLLCASAGCSCRALIRASPEPEPPEPPTPTPARGAGRRAPKELYADLAAPPAPGLEAAARWSSAGRRRRRRRSRSAGTGRWSTCCRWCRSASRWRRRLAHPAAADARRSCADATRCSSCWRAGLLARSTRDIDELVRAGWAGWSRSAVFWLLWFVYPPAWASATCGSRGVLGLALGYLGWGELLVGLYAGFLLVGVGSARCCRCGGTGRRASASRSARSCWSARCVGIVWGG